MTIRQPTHSTGSTNIADLLERILDKGVVIAGDVKIKLVDIELLSIQLRLVICSVDKAKEMGMDWWVNNPAFMSQPPIEAEVKPVQHFAETSEREQLETRVRELEAMLGERRIEQTQKESA